VAVAEPWQCRGRISVRISVRISGLWSMNRDLWQWQWQRDPNLTAPFRLSAQVRNVMMGDHEDPTKRRYVKEEKRGRTWKI
jgi:hypothetical protein